MNIPELIKEAHQNAVDKGFYPKGEEKNIGELIMLIVSELGEALEAHRNGRFAEKMQKLYDTDLAFWHSENDKFLEQLDGLQKRVIKNVGIENWLFNRYIKDTFEDEIADVFIRLFDLCGYLEIEPVRCSNGSSFPTENIGESLLFLSSNVMAIYNGIEDYRLTNISFLTACLVKFCQQLNIPIEKHIAAKMAYNKTRPHKHGKNY